MDLLLWRHAEAEEAQPGQKDADRRLTEKGLKQAKRIAHWIKPHLPKKLTILASPTRRTQETALALGLPFTREPRLSPETDVADLLAAAGWPENGPVLLVGHQPTLGRLAALLLAGQEAEWTIKKGALWWISRRSREDGTRVVLRLVLDPSFLT